VLLSSLQSDGRRVLLLCALGWGGPLLLVTAYYSVPAFQVPALPRIGPHRVTVYLNTNLYN
jgi:hypothetical protein